MQFYVCPQSTDDTHPEASEADRGTIEKPFRSLTDARDAVRRWRSNNPGAEIEVVLRGGVYSLSEPLALGPKDAGAVDRPVVWRAYENENPILSGALEVTGWQRLENEPEHLHPAAHERVWVADLPDGVQNPRALFSSGKRLPRARGEGFALEPLPDSIAKSADDRRLLAFPEGAMEDWPDLTQTEIVVIPKNWSMNILPIESVDIKNGTARTGAPATYPLQSNWRDENTWVENTLAVLREPGMWVCDPGKSNLYLWPEDNEEPARITASATSELLRIEGEVHEEAGTDAPVHGIVLRGLEFARGNRHPWHGRTGRGLQHDWDRHDEPTAMLRLRAASDCRVEQCVFRDSPAGGVRIDLHASNNQVLGCSFTRLGGTAVTLAGYGLGTKNVNRRNTVINNDIQNIGQDYWHSPAIFVWQSEANHIAHNRIRNVPYTGIVCSGRTHWDRTGKGDCAALIRWDEVETLLGPDYRPARWTEGWYEDWRRREPLMHSRDNVIEYNDISEVMQVLSDGNGIYISGAGAGNIVRHNHIHDCPSPTMSEGIRCDNDQHETLIQSNLVHHIGGMGTGICIKGLNAVIDNIVALPLVEETARGMISLETGPLYGNPVRRNIVLVDTPSQAFYAQSRIHGENRQPMLRDCQAEDNLYWCVKDPSHAENHLETERQHCVELHSRAQDPLFKDPQAGDFRLRPDSPAHEMGIQLPEIDRTGPDESWPMPKIQTDS